jgi:hypothetical protein
LPKLAIYCGVKNSTSYQKRGYASIFYEIKEYFLNDENNPDIIKSGNIISNSNLGSGIVADHNLFQWRDTVNGEWLLETTESNISRFHGYFRKYTETTAADPSYIVENVQIKPDRKYVIEISLYQFPDKAVNDTYDKFTDTTPSAIVETTATRRVNSSGSLLATTYKTSRTPLTTAQIEALSNFVTYGIGNETIVYTSSTPYSVLSLIQKAIINSSIYEKQDGIYIADVNNFNVPFYISNKYADTQYEDVDNENSVISDLSSTKIVETFYNQKNLWEVLVDAGHYIHAIPEIKFGKDDRFEITFNRLGRTDKKNKKGTKVSIYNSRSVEDYISATSSYVSNMVQLDGYIEEWVSPKTKSENLLVSNETANIIVSKPIIELMSIHVRNNETGEIKDMTNFVYEENVYKTLGLDFDEIPNRGIALFYSLGDNSINGGDFRLPQANYSIYNDFAIKKVIWSAFYGYEVVSPAPERGFWTDLQVNKYSFLVRYRTKDSVRQSHARPDLRKYLLNSKYDKFPEHNQFNNQTDVVVDSAKFGNNIYGKLIKTGNSSYFINEWNSNFDDIKHKGELYNINGELYYVAKVTHTFFSTYILSEVEFSKDYNELSAVVGIPSEPRFYEISEQSLIWREFAINDLLLLTDDKQQLDYNNSFVFDYDHLSSLVLESETDFARYVVTTFKGDKDTDIYSQAAGERAFYKDVISPINAYSSENTLTYEWDMVDNYSAGDKVVPVNDYKKDVEVADLAYGSLRAVGYTDVYGKAALMDFYILGNIDDLTAEQIKNLPESPIKTRAITFIGEITTETPPTSDDLTDFVFQNTSDQRKPQDGDFINITLTGEETKKYVACYSSSGWGRFIGDYDFLGTNVKSYDTNFNGRGIGLIKDCREAISTNFNLQLITNSDTFVVSPFFYSPNKTGVKAVLLANEVNKLSSGFIGNAEIITPVGLNGELLDGLFDFDIYKEFSTSSWDENKEVVSLFGIDFSQVFQNVNENHFNGNENYQQVKSIAIICGFNSKEAFLNGVYEKQLVFARNIPADWTKEKALSSVYFGAPKKDKVFTNKQ